MSRRTLVSYQDLTTTPFTTNDDTTTRGAEQDLDSRRKRKFQQEEEEGVVEDLDSSYKDGGEGKGKKRKGKKKGRGKGKGGGGGSRVHWDDPCLSSHVGSDSGLVGGGEMGVWDEDGWEDHDMQEEEEGDYGEGEEDNDEEEEEEEDHTWVDYDEQEEVEGDDSILVGQPIDWQGLGGMAGPSSSSSSKMEKRGNMERGKGNKGTIKEQGRALTHQEIWDDTALINAWQAAEDEYKLFHSRRLKASSLQADPANHEYIHRPGSETTTATVPQPDPASTSAHPLSFIPSLLKQSSPLWFESPPPGSAAALAAKEASKLNIWRKGEESRIKRETKALKEQQQKQQQQQQQQQLNRQVADGETKHASSGAEVEGTTFSKPVHGDNGEATKSSGGGVKANATTTTTPIVRRKGGKGITPPSSSLPGNAAWMAACATVSRTPNRIGDQPMYDGSLVSNLVKVEDKVHQTPVGTFEPQGKGEAQGDASIKVPRDIARAFPALENGSSFRSDTGRGDDRFRCEEGGGGKGEGSRSTGGATSSQQPNLTLDKEESMQNLIMAWYYAGYYTALHQGFSNHPQP